MSKLKDTNIIVPEEVHQALRDKADEAGMNFRQYLLSVFRYAIEDTMPMAPAITPPPTLRTVLEAYHKGEKLLGPCGETWPCAMETKGVDDCEGVEWCRACNVRLN